MKLVEEGGAPVEVEEEEEELAEEPEEEKELFATEPTEEAPEDSAEVGEVLAVEGEE